MQSFSKLCTFICFTAFTPSNTTHDYLFTVLRPTRKVFGTILFNTWTFRSTASIVPINIPAYLVNGVASFVSSIFSSFSNVDKRSFFPQPFTSSPPSIKHFPFVRLSFRNFQRIKLPLLPHVGLHRCCISRHRGYFYYIRDFLLGYVRLSKFISFLNFPRICIPYIFLPRSMYGIFVVLCFRLSLLSSAGRS